MTTWYYADAQQQRVGPLTVADMARLSTSGTVRPETLVWREGLANWTAWRTVAHEVLGAAPPPAPVGGDANYAPPKAALHDEGAYVSGGHVVYAGFWKRVAASIIDGIATSVVFWVLMIPLFALIGGGMSVMTRIGDGSAGVVLTLLYYSASIVLPMLYMAWMHASSSQATLGKMAVGIKVVRGNGERISFLRGIGRYFGYLLSSLILGIGLIIAGFTERKQALHDFLCDTLVVDKYAFTAHPEWQREGLGGVAITVLVLAGLFVLLMVVMVVIAIAAVASSGGWH